MSGALADQAARQLISVDGLSETLFVEAGAGTGKTTQLVDRIVNTVLHRGTPLSAIAAITFTEAAATELQKRLRVAFEQAAIDGPDPERARQAIADADLAVISTVHGFASRLLGEFAVAAELPPRVAVVDEVASQIANERRWERFVDMLHGEADYEELLRRAALIEVPLDPRYPGQASLKDVAVNFAQNWDRLDDLLDRSVGGEPPPIDFTEFDQAVDELAGVREHCTDPSDKFAIHLETLLPKMREVVDITDEHRKLRRLQAQRAGQPPWKKWGPGQGGARGNWSIDVKDAKALVGEVNAALDRVLGQVGHDVLEQLIRLIAHEVRAAAGARQSDGRLEFHDLLVLARRMLRTRPDVRVALHERYQHILLDEFQDTDPIQIELASLIAAAPQDVQPVGWADHHVDAGRLFFVGDPKQSIYRFRRADIKLFLKARAAFTEGRAEPVRLATNFRTVEPIIDWVNGLYATVMHEVDGAQPGYEPLAAARSASGQADHRPVILGPVDGHTDPAMRAGDLRRAEADDVARAVTAIMNAPQEWPVDDGAGGWRPARLDDVTILIPTRTSLPYLRDALAAFDVPYRLATGTLVYDTQEVRDALAVLRAVDDPNDTISLVAALRSPLYGCADTELFEYHQAAKKWNLRAATPEALTDEHPVVAALAHLRGLWEQRWWTGPAAMLQRVVTERRGFLLGYGARRPEEVWRRLRFVLDQARAFEESSGRGLRDFLDWTALQSADGARVHEPMLPETDGDALQILTVHGAKGLEFPITILSGLTTAASGKRNGVSVVWRDTGPPEVGLRAGVATAEHSTHADLEEEMDAHEKLRLLYVATTRARDHLVVSGHFKVPGPTSTVSVDATYAGKLATFAADRPDLCRRIDLADVEPPGPRRRDAVPAAVADPGADVGERQRWIEARRALLAPYESPSAVSATAIARSVDAEIVDVDTDEVDESSGQSSDADSTRVIVRKKGRAGSAVGSALHAVMEIVDFDRPDTIEALARRQADLHGVPDAADTVIRQARAAMESAAVQLARRHRSYRELYVGAPLGDTMVEGYVDLLVSTPDGLVIVDYKTDTVSTPAAVDAKLAAYELQGATYAVALEATTGLTVTECRFVFCAAAGAVERSVADLEGAKQRVRDAVAAGVIQPAVGSVSNTAQPRSSSA